jgi:hypothetical protein
MIKTNKKRNKSEFREVIESVKYMTKNLNDIENPLPKIKINKNE